MDDQLRVPVQTSEGKTVLENWNPVGKQSDGSQYFIPRPMTDPSHEHQYNWHPQNNRMVICKCGHGGMLHPHKGRLVDGHIYTLDGRKVV